MPGKNATERLAPDREGLERAADILRRGGLVALPTETVYGLAARADDTAAVARIYAAKGRPGFNPLIVHVASLDQALELGQFSQTALDLAAAYWPGPLTLVVPRQERAMLADAVTAGLPTIALRCPAHAVMRDMITRVGAPLAAPSANRSAFISPTTAAHVLATLDGAIDAVVDGGPTDRGLESTIVAVRDSGGNRNPSPGAAPVRHSDLCSGDAIEAPGALSRHYAPGKPLRLEALAADADEFFISFGEQRGDCALSADGNLEEAAARLYLCLHRGAQSAKPRMAVAPIPARGVGIAINDRLRRAASDGA